MIYSDELRKQIILELRSMNNSPFFRMEDDVTIDEINAITDADQLDSILLKIWFSPKFENIEQVDESNLKDLITSDMYKTLLDYLHVKKFDLNMSSNVVEDNVNDALSSVTKTLLPFSIGTIVGMTVHSCVRAHNDSK